MFSFNDLSNVIYTFVRNILSIDDSKQYGGSKERVVNVINQFHKNDPKIKELARGGGGIIVYDINEPKIVYKISKKTDTCRTWSSEHDKYTKMIENFDINSHTNLVKLIVPIDYINTNTVCGFSMDRIITPLHDRFPNALAIHPLFGNELSLYNIPARGVFIDLKTIREVLPNVEDYIAELGKFMGYLHYFCKMDGFDLEILLGKDNKNNFCLYVIDFDLANFIESYDDDETIRRLSWAFESMEYFPTTDQSTNYAILRKNYLEIADQAGKREIAMKVLDEESIPHQDVRDRGIV